MFDTLLRRGLRSPFAYLAAVASVSLLLLLLLRVQASGDVVWLAFMLPVLVSGAVGGLGPALAAAGLSALSVDYFFIPTPQTLKLPLNAHDFIAFVVFSSASALAARVSYMSRRATLEEERADAESARVAAAGARRNLLLELGVRASAGGSIEAIYRDATTMITTALEVEHCAIFQLSRTGDLALVSASGWDAGVTEGLTI